MSTPLPKADVDRVAGNAHNQLAVLAAYLDNNFNAVYRYMRSLAVRNPFLMARENLVKQFHTCNELLAPYMAIIDGGTRNKRRGGGSKVRPLVQEGGGLYLTNA